MQRLYPHSFTSLTPPVPFSVSGRAASLGEGGPFDRLRAGSFDRACTEFIEVLRTGRHRIIDTRERPSRQPRLGGEVATKGQLLDDKAMGMVILDATEPQGTGIIAAMLGGRYLALDLTSLTSIQLDLHPFSNYQSNLR